jgi:hypothetical protein
VEHPLLRVGALLCPAGRAEARPYWATTSTERRTHRSAPPDPVASTAAPALPAWKAFVVQFSQASAGASPVFDGRIEHLHSGRRVRFASREDLLAALERMLDELEGPAGSEEER